jgi:hypothetical protein
VAFCAPSLVGEMSPVATTLTPGFGLRVGDCDGLGLGEGDGQGLFGRGSHEGEGEAVADTGAEPESLPVSNTSNTSTAAEATSVITRDIVEGFTVTAQ